MIAIIADHPASPTAGISQRTMLRKGCAKPNAAYFSAIRWRQRLLNNQSD
jgi:hypothetical protein